MRASNEGLLIPPTSIRGVAKDALYCAHRVIYMFPPSLLVFSLGMGAD
jgi:hypothetical protein